MTRPNSEELTDSGRENLLTHFAIRCFNVNSFLELVCLILQYLNDTLVTPTQMKQGRMIELRYFFFCNMML